MAKRRDLLAGAWVLHGAVPNECRVPIGKRRGEGGQEAFDVAFSRVDEGRERVVVDRRSRLAVILGFVLESGEVDDSAAGEGVCLVGGRNSHCGRQLLRQTDGHVVLAKGNSFCSGGGDAVLLVSHTVVAEIQVKLSVGSGGSGGSAVGGVDGGSIGDLLGTIVAIDRNIFVVPSLRFI